MVLRVRRIFDHPEQHLTSRLTRTRKDYAPVNFALGGFDGDATHPHPHDSRTSYGQAVLIGGGAIVADEYPVRGGFPRENAEVARFSMAAPTRETGTFGYPVLRQDIEIQVLADQASAQSTTIDALRVIADAVGFASMQRVVKLPSIANAAPTAAPPPTQTLPIMSPIRMPTELVEIKADWLSFLRVAGLVPGMRF